MFFITIERLWKSSHKVCIFRAETVKEYVQLLLNIFFYVQDCVSASGNISMFFKERATASEKILRKNVRLLLNDIKGTLTQIWNSPYMLVLV